MPIIFAIIFVVVLVVSILLIVKFNKKAKDGTLEAWMNKIFPGEEDVMEEGTETNVNYTCEYCGSNMGSETECKNCGATITKK